MSKPRIFEDKWELLIMLGGLGVSGVMMGFILWLMYKVLAGGYHILMALIDKI